MLCQNLPKLGTSFLKEFKLRRFTHKQFPGVKFNKPSCILSASTRNFGFHKAANVDFNFGFRSIKRFLEQCKNAPGRGFNIHDYVLKDARVFVIALLVTGVSRAFIGSLLTNDKLVPVKVLGLFNFWLRLILVIKAKCDWPSAQLLTN